MKAMRSAQWSRPALVILLAAAPVRAGITAVTYVGPNGGLWGTAANWSPAGVPDSVAATGDHAVTVNGAADDVTVLMDVVGTAIITSLIVDAGDGVTIQNNRTLRIGVGPVANDGLIAVTSTGTNTNLQVDNNVVLTGSGEIVLSGGAGNARITSASGADRLIQEAGHTIRGGGSIGPSGSLLLMTNHGTIRADDRLNALSIQFTTGAANENDGVWEATGGATLRYSGTSNNDLINTGGVIRALDGSTFELAGGSGGDIFGGTIETEDSGQILVTGGPITLHDLSLDANVNVPNNERLRLGGAVTNNGTITVTAAGNITAVDVNTASATLQGSGELVLNDGVGGARLSAVSLGHDLQHGPDHTIRGGGEVFGVELNNHGLVVADDPLNPLTVDDGGVGGAVLSNDGTFRAEGGATLRALSIVLENSGGLIEALDRSVVQVPSTHIIGGTLDTEGSGQIVTDNQDVTLEDVTNNGDLLQTGIAAHTAELVGTLTNNGVVNLEHRLGVDAGDVLINGAGEIVLGPASTVIGTGANTSGNLTNGAGHTIRGRICTNCPVGWNGDLFNEGTILVDVPLSQFGHGGGLDNSGLIHILAGSELSIGANVTVNQNSGEYRIDADGTLECDELLTQTGGQTIVNGLMDMGVVAFEVQGGVVSGSGVIDFAGGVNPPDVANSGTLSPGTSAGTLTITDGEYVQSSRGTLRIEIGGFLPGLEHDQLVVTDDANLSGGRAALAGTLEVVLVDDFVPCLGGTVTFLVADDVEGQFENLDLPSIPGATLSVVYAPMEVRLLVQPADNPADLNHDGLVDGADLGLLLLAWGRCVNTCCPEDLNFTDDVDGADLGILLLNWTG